MTFKDKFNQLKNIEKDYFNLTLNNELIYPYLRRVIWNKISNDENIDIRTLKKVKPYSQDNILLEKQASCFIKKNQDFDVLLVPFFRPNFDGEKIIDAYSENIYQQLLKNNKVLRLINRNETAFRLDDENTFYIDDVINLYEKRLFDVQKPTNQELVRLKEFNDKISENLKIEIDFIVFINEFLHKTQIFHKFYRELLKATKPKIIIAPASYLIPEIVIIAKELNIPVADIQYAALTFGHIGYDFAYKYPFFPDMLLLWSNFWKRKEVFGEQNCEYINFGKENFNNYQVETTTKSVCFISQNLIIRFILNEAIKFASNFPKITTYIKLHPNDVIENYYLEKIANINNLSLVYGDETNWQASEIIVGVGSSLLFELLDSKRKIIVLKENYMSLFMEGFSDKENVYFVKDLIKEFVEIQATPFNQVDLQIYQKSKDLSLNIPERQTFAKANYALIENFHTILKNNHNIFYEKIDRTKQELFLAIVVFNNTSNQNQELLNYSLRTIINRKDVEIIYIEDLNQYVLNKKAKYCYFLNAENNFLYADNLELAIEDLYQYSPDILKTSINVLEKQKNNAISQIKIANSQNKPKFLLNINQYLHNHIYKQELINDLTIINNEIIFNKTLYQKAKKILCRNYALSVFITNNNTQQNDLLITCDEQKVYIYYDTNLFNKKYQDIVFKNQNEMYEITLNSIFNIYKLQKQWTTQIKAFDNTIILLVKNYLFIFSSKLILKIKNFVLKNHKLKTFIKEKILQI